MLDRNETALLRAIAEEPGDHTAPLVFADWLEERGDNPRADFIRAQCELTSDRLPEGRRRALRLRERQLLDAHRHEWCQSLGLPVEDVSFARGCVTAMRLSHWDGGKMLDAALAPRLVPLVELDLSGLGMGDGGLAAFAERAQLPALRKLILSDNGISDAGAAALARAAGLPRLETVYLFKNAVTDGARAALQASSRFQPKALDLGEREEGYCMSPGEAEMARRSFVRTHLLPVVSRHFTTYQRLQSAMLCVAQYWADEADDAVHASLIVSELFEPTLVGVQYDGGPTPDPNLPNTFIKSKYGEGSTSMVSLWETDVRWDDNNGAIPLWAAFAHEEGSQESDLETAYAPAVMFYRHGGYEFLPMRRPHLDGVRPEWGWEEE